MATGIYSRRRTIALMGIFALVYLALVGRMGFLQLVRGEELLKKGFYYRMRPIPIQGDRGEILDRNGQPLLQNVVCESIYAQPLLIKNKRQAAQALAPVLGMKLEDVETRMNKLSFFEWLKRKVKPETVEQVKKLKIEGIGFAAEKCRDYPEEDLAVHVLGISNLDHQGIEGLDLWYNKYLKAENGAVQCEFTARGQPMPGGECVVLPGKSGYTLQTTLEIGMQRLAERSTERAALETRAGRTTIMIMDVKTGGMLALAQYPKYDPLLGGNSDQTLRRIFTVADTLPPGSIFKPVTAAAALDSGVITKDSHIDDPGCMNVAGWSICNWDHRGLGSVKIDTVMAKSSNVGFGKLGMMLGKDRFYDYHARFGFNKPTGIDLPGEAVGQWVAKKNATELDLAIQGFGQTLTVSPIQMLTAIAAIANDGKRMQPHFAQALLDENGNVVRRFEPQMAAQAVKPEVARYVQELMVGVVETGTGKNARVPGYKVGGKTGTATKVIDGKVAKGRYIASFVGFAPYPNPQVAVLISVDDPQGAYYGGQIAAPIFGEVMGEILAYLNLPLSNDPPPPAQPGFPEPPKPPQKALVPSVVNLPREDAERIAKAAGFEIIFNGSGTEVTEQFPRAGSTAYKGGQMAVNTDPPEAVSQGKVHVPALAGKSLRDAAAELAVRELLMEPIGSGVVVKQEPAAGTLLPKGRRVRVWLEPPSQR